MDRFVKTKTVEDNPEFDVAAFLLPVGCHKTEIIETDFCTTNSLFLSDYFPNLFNKNGKLKKKTRMYIEED